MNVIREFSVGLLTVRVFWIWMIAGAFTTVAGPFGTYEGLAPLARGAYWFGIIGVSLVIAFGWRAVVRTWLPTLSGWGATLALSSGLTVLFTPVLYAISVRVAGGPEMLDFPPLAMGAVVFLVPVVLSSLRRIMRGEAVADPVPDLSTSTRTAPVSVPRPQRPRLLERLPKTASRRVLRLTVRDHYVDVHTDCSVQTLLMRFGDAVAELDELPGLRVHRSHWVARDAVVASHRRNGRVFLQLADRTEVPVSRTYLDDVERAGMLRESA